jgi:nitrite reductase/ring-hydroxylating ferredoxin subunit
MSTVWSSRPNAPAPGTVLAQLDQIPADNGLECRFGEGEKAFLVVLFKVVVDGQPIVKGYVNECPHFFIPYNFTPDVFCVYKIDGHKDLMCAHHTAMFHLADGFCYEGPCAGKRLSEVPVTVEDGRVLVGVS